MEQVTVIGAGAMGRQIALQCALRGLPVVLHDSGGNALAKATAFFGEYLEGRIAKGKLPSVSNMTVVTLGCAPASCPMEFL